MNIGAFFYIPDSTRYVIEDCLHLLLHLFVESRFFLLL